MKLILCLSFFGIILSTLVFAETTFFDNSNDAFIIGDSSTTDSSTTKSEMAESEETTATTSSIGCRYEWNCADWSTCLSSGNQTRNCTNTGSCPDTYNSPSREQNCVYTPSKETEKEDKEVVYEDDNEESVKIEDERYIDEKTNQNEEKTNENKLPYFNKWIILSIILVCVWYIVFKYIWR